MHEANTSSDTEAEIATGRLRFRDFRRIVAIGCRYKGTLLLGVVCTTIFACLQTVSLGGAFPVFKILLEDEGIHHWIDRSIAGQRLGVEFAEPTASEVVLLGVEQDSDLHQAGVRPGDRLVAGARQSAAELLRDLAWVAPGARTSIVAESAGDANQQRRFTVMATELEPTWRLARWAVSLIPEAAEEQKLRTLEYLVAGLIVVVMLASVFRYFGEVMIAKAVLRSMMRLRGDLYDRTLRLPMSFFAGQSTSDIVGRFVQDVQETQRGLLALFKRFIREPLRAVFILVLACSLDWRVTLTIVAVAPLLILLFWWVGRHVKKSTTRLLEAYGAMIGALTTSLDNLKYIKAHTAEKHEQDRLRRIDWRVFREQLNLAKFQAFVTPAIESLAVLLGSLMILWLAARVLDHDLSISKFIALGVVLSVLFDPLRRLTSVYVRILRASAGAERIFQVIDQPVEDDLSTARSELQPLERVIEFVHVTFTYPGGETPALSDVSLSIEKGQTLAIVGPGDSGKTTLVSMLQRFFDPDSGRILFDGVDIRAATLQSLREQIGLVSRDGLVIDGTPMQNIAYGATAPDAARVRSAAGRAAADEFIAVFPDRYHASLGDGGVSLSHGQRQRLAVARAIFRDAPILIFDDATSQVDSESESKIQLAIRDFSKDRTTLMITRHPGTIRRADRIVVMDAGRIVDVGGHDELLRRCPIYQGITKAWPQDATAEAYGAWSV